MKPDVLKTSIYTLMALLAFAGNSILCRLALNDTTTIDAGMFTYLRLLSGAVTLSLITIVYYYVNHYQTRNDEKQTTPSVATFNFSGAFSTLTPYWISSFWLFSYALNFSIAYILLETGTGALILFGSVQITIVLLTIRTGIIILWQQIAGIVLAFSGLIYLLFPTATSPHWLGSIFMLLAGISWALYTLSGKRNVPAVIATTYNFVLTIPWVIAALICQLILFSPETNLTETGVILAIMSGVVTSAAGYVIWFVALKHLSAITAGVIQLSVPIMAAIGGVIMLNEAIDSRFIVAAALTLSGIYVVIKAKNKQAE